MFRGESSLEWTMCCIKVRHHSHELVGWMLGLQKAGFQPCSHCMVRLGCSVFTPSFSTSSAFLDPKARWYQKSIRYCPWQPTKKGSSRVESSCSTMQWKWGFSYRTPICGYFQSTKWEEKGTRLYCKIDYSGVKQRWCQWTFHRYVLRLAKYVNLQHVPI